MPRAAAPLVALAIAAGVLAPAQAAQAAQTAQTAPAAAPARSTTATGHDVSYPQCGGTLPDRGDIAVVGVNAGTGTTTNPCLAAQLAWGDAVQEDGSQQLADVYVNTANPGHLGGWWPRADLSRTGLPVANPEGACLGAEDAACAYVYGWSVAADDLQRRGVTSAGQRTWWLDVETMNTWSWNRRANLAVLEGMTDAIRRAGARVGVYSTSRQWDLIVGSTAPSSTLAGVQAWAAGATTRGGAEALCRAGSFVPGGRLAMAQWTSGGQDQDVACSPGVTGSVPAITGTAVAGGILLADPGAWGPSGVAFTYRWLRDGVAVPGASGPVYAVTATDTGTQLTVEVRGSRPGAPALVLTSDPVDVAPTAAPDPVTSLPAD